MATNQGAAMKIKTTIKPKANKGFKRAISDNAVASERLLRHQIQQVREEKAVLEGKLALVTTENNNLKNKYATVLKSLLSAKYLTENLQSKNLLEIPLEDIVVMLSMSAHRQHTSGMDTMATRLEELETRLTFHYNEMAKLLRLKMRVEDHLKEINGSSNLETAKSISTKIYDESRNTEIFIPSSEIIVLKVKANSKDAAHSNRESCSEMAKTRKIPTRKSWKELNVPLNRLPGDTHIKDMDKGLMQYISQELNLEKVQGNDWRLLAERVGIPEHTVAEWKKKRVENPFKQVLMSWSNSPSATVRMLHRHLASPQLRNIVLAKVLTDFYQVD